MSIRLYSIVLYCFAIHLFVTLTCHIFLPSLGTPTVLAWFPHGYFVLPSCLSILPVPGWFLFCPTVGGGLKGDLYFWSIVIRWAVMSLLMATPSALVILRGLCLRKNFHGGHKWHSIMTYNCFTLPVQILFIHLSIVYKLDEPEFCFCGNPTLYSTHHVVLLPSNHPTAMGGG